MISELDFVKQVVLFSDKCTLKESEKMEGDYERDLVTRRTTKIKLGKYLKNTEKLIEKPDENNDQSNT